MHIKCQLIDEGCRMVTKFSYANKDYKVSLWTPWLAGFLIAVIASAFGVGGGFLLVPFMVSFLMNANVYYPCNCRIGYLY
jgi:uncharacterized membrane protein YfcA